MAIKISLRRDTSFSPFRKELIDLCRARGLGDLILCSGYIWEGGAYSVLDDDLLEAIKLGIGSNQVICVAGKLARKPIDWHLHYNKFFSKISGAGIKVAAHVAPKRNWHAKIAMRLDTKGQPVAAIVGSSNLTGPAYGENRYTWNYECDVTMWSPVVRGGESGMERNDDQDPFTFAVVDLDDSFSQPSIDSRLQVLFDDIFRERESFVDLANYSGE
ncbi:hypothetical protein [Stenotrophomonas sp. LM091]|uniref:hypothetical protein n=1 Tax=Stenotrophomonas sp. LM091 TaxID=1904944 RepID=UPI0012EA02A0|nr:hypothetical protein [Stenotrophomonas sp. LM091]